MKAISTLTATAATGVFATGFVAANRDTFARAFHACQALLALTATAAAAVTSTGLVFAIRFAQFDAKEIDAELQVCRTVAAIPATAIASALFVRTVWHTSALSVFRALESVTALTATAAATVGATVLAVAVRSTTRTLTAHLVLFTTDLFTLDEFAGTDPVTASLVGPTHTAGPPTSVVPALLPPTFGVARLDTQGLHAEGHSLGAFTTTTTAPVIPALHFFTIGDTTAFSLLRALEALSAITATATATVTSTHLSITVR